MELNFLPLTWIVWSFSKEKLNWKKWKYQEYDFHLILQKAKCFLYTRIKNEINSKVVPDIHAGANYFNNWIQLMHAFFIYCKSVFLSNSLSVYHQHTEILIFKILTPEEVAQQVTVLAVHMWGSECWSSENICFRRWMCHMYL